MPSHKRPAAAANGPASKKARESQPKDFAERAASISEQNAIVLVTPPKYDATPTIARYIALRQKEELSLTFFVTDTSYVAHAVSAAIGSDFTYCFQYDKQHKRIKSKLLKGESVLTTCTPILLDKLALGEARQAAKAQGDSLDPMNYFKGTILSMLHGTKCTTIRIVVKLQTVFAPRLQAGLAQMRKAADPIKVVVTTLAPTSDVDEKMLKILTGCSTTCIVEQTEEETAALEAEQRNLPAAVFEAIKMPDPQLDATEVGKIKSLIVGSMLNNEQRIGSRACLEHATSKVLAKVAHGGALTPYLAQTPMYRVGKTGKLTGTLAPRHTALVVAHSTLSGAEAAMVELQAGNDDGAAFHDLRGSKVGALNTKIGEFAVSFSNQAGLTMGIINPTSSQSSDELRKATTAIAAVGCKWDESGLQALADRFCKRTKPSEGDMIPKQFTVIHLDSDWQRSVLGVCSTEVSPRDVTLSDQEASTLDQIRATDRPDKKVIEANTYKLALADSRKLLGDSTMCLDYLTSITDDAKGVEAQNRFKEACESLLSYKVAA